MANIKLKDFSGENDQYDNVLKVWLESAFSTEENRILLPFTYGEAVSGDVEPNFSTGNMSVEIPEGKLISELTIRKPPALTPGNIREGVNIAGIIGSLVAGSGGGSSGPFKMTTGVYKPKAATRVFDDSPGTYSGFKINSKGLWEKTITGGDFKPIGGRQYYIVYFSELFRVAKTHTSFSSYGKCVTLGNEAIVTGKQEDIGAGEFLLIYQGNLNKLTILAIVSGGKYTADGETWQPEDIYVWDVEECKGGMVIQHGGTKKPDAVFVIQTATLGISDPNGMYYAAWGIQSSLAHMMPRNVVGGTVGLLGHSSTDAPLEAEYNGNFLYCPNESEFAFYPDADFVVFSPNYDCWWFAIWGISEQS